MSTAYVTLETVQGRALTGSTLLIPDDVPAGSTETVAVSGVNAQTTLAATQAGQVFVVDPVGGDMWMAGGPNPNAGNAPRRRLKDGAGPYYFAATAAGHKLAFLDV